MIININNKSEMEKIETLLYFCYISMKLCLIIDSYSIKIQINDRD